MIDRAKHKRFNLLCKEYRLSPAFSLWRFNIVANTWGAPSRLPLFKGDKQANAAWREHVRNLIQHYAKKQKLKCGHYSRHEICYICREQEVADAIFQFERMKLRRNQGSIWGIT